MLFRSTLSSGATTNDNRPTLTFTAEAGSTVAVYDGSTLLGTATEGPAGTFTFTPGTALTDGAHSLSAKATDTAGNTSAATTPFALTVDTSAPSVTLTTVTDDVPGITGTVAGSVIAMGVIALPTMLRALRTLPVPVVAMVQGPAIGLGVGLVAACDIAVAADVASFRLTEVRLGILPAVISPHLIDAIGERACRRYFLSAEAFSAADALRLGLLHEVCPPEGLEATVSRIVSELLTGKPGAQKAAKALIEAQRSPALDEALIADTARRLTDIRGGREAQDALAEFLRK